MALFGNQNVFLVLVYSDKGCAKECVDFLSRFFHEHFRKTGSDGMPLTVRVRDVSGLEIRTTNRLNTAKLLVIPPGIASLFASELNGIGNSRIRQFVQNGGRFIGLCGGAYYSSTFSEFAKGTDQEIIGIRELAFYPGTVRGPTLAPYVYNSYKGARIAKLKLNKSIGLETDQFDCYYNGGGSFVNANDYENVDTLATYENNEAAIVRGSFGHGKYLLSSVHLEMDPTCFALFPIGSQIDGRDILLNNNTLRINLFRKLVNSLF